MISRRSLLRRTIAASTLALPGVLDGPIRRVPAADPVRKDPWFLTRGVVLVLGDLRTLNWPEREKKIPWNGEVFRSDLETYARRGIRHVTSFAAWIDADYVKRFGEPPLDEYGQGLGAGPFPQ